ncbi:hypothetical protein GCK32_008470 [Trichostrongylus colubriformis]|uniref:Fibronectin type-III domain-containing protein n=2 Tax=Trichostrongylus colubriformis TaxID=6319 RepID=A0AAN8FNL9_TRICO
MKSFPFKNQQLSFFKVGSKGSSTLPTVTFTILDPCRDYKFRVIVVLRSSDPIDHFVIYGEKSIPVELPPFVLTSDQISAEKPMFNETTDSLKVYVRWTLPRGYSDSDVYGYEAPALYPIQCRIPEDELPQPKIEIVRAGGRLVVLLPTSVLDARCRLWVEVRMLPRCVRLEPFSVQKNVEINCDRNSSLELCRGEGNPICMEVQDITGKHGRATLTWVPPPRIPLYYHVRYGPAKITGDPPTIWQIATKKDIKVDASVTSLTLEVTENQDFGVQVCAILSKIHKRPKFGLAPVTIFHCTSCYTTSSHAVVGRCGECIKVDKNPAAKGWKNVVKSRTPTEPHKAEVLPSRTFPIRVVQSPTVYRMEADLLVAKKGHDRHSATNISVAQVNTHPADAPIAIERAEEINELATTSIASPTSSTITTSTTFGTTSTSSTTTTTAELPATTESEESFSSPTPTIEVTSTDMTTTSEKFTITTKNSVVVDVMADLIHTKSQDPGATSDNPITLEGIPGLQVLEDKDPEPLVHHTSSIRREELSKELEESVKHLEEALDAANFNRKLITEQSLLMPSTANHTSLKEDPIMKAASEIVNKLESSSAEVRHHEKSKKCLLSTGIVCNFGCETSKTCRCPPTTHVLSPEGGCVSRDSFGNVFCLHSIDINATWDPIPMNVMIHSEEVADHIRSVFGADRLFVEFGRVIEERKLPNGSWAGPFFDGTRRTRMVIAIEKLVRSGAFVDEPFVFHLNDSVNIADELYGIRFCTFNSTRIKDPYERDWDVDVVANKTGNLVQVIPVSLIHFTYDARSESVLRGTNDSFWSAFFVIGKVMLLVVLVLIMFVLVYLNCSRIRLLYDRKRTHYFRPYYLDPQVQAPSMHPYIQERNKRGGLYQNRTRVIYKSLYKTTKMNCDSECKKHEHNQKAQEMGDAAKEKVQNATDAVKETAQKAYNKAGELKDKAKQKIQETADDAKKD